MPRFRKIVFTIAVALAVLVTAGACSSSSSGAGSAASSSSTGSAPPASSSLGSGSPAAAQATGSPITIGVLCSCSGPFGSTIASSYKVFLAWEKSVNASGGLNGHPVTLIEKDNASNPATALTNAQALISAKVSLIMDLDILDEVWQKPASAAKIPVVGGAFTSEPFYTDPDWYPSGQTNDSIVNAVIATAKQAGAKNLGQLYCAESVQCQQSVAPIEAAGAKAGVKVIYNASIAAAAPNYTAQCLAAKQAGVTALFIGDSISIIARVASDCNAQGYDPIYVTEGTGFTDQALTTPGLKDNLWSPFPILPYFATAPAVTAMNTVLDKYYPGIQNDPNTWSEFAAQAWTGGLLIQAAANAAGFTASDTVTSADWTKGLESVSGQTLGGFSPTLTFTAGKAHSVDCWYVGRVKGGVASQVGGQVCSNAS
jgi:branched-chain amino acid transport system substrate-binding protein